MIQLENPTYIITGGYYKGDSAWNDKYSHSDDCYKLYYITQGELWIESSHGRHHLSEGGLYLINGYKLLSYGTESCFSTYWIHFKAQNIVLSNTMFQLPAVTQLPHSIIDVIDELGGCNIYQVNSTQLDIMQRLRLQSVLQLILVGALQTNNLDVIKESEELSRIEPAIKHIYNHLNTTIKLEDLATCCCLSVSHFCKIFKTAMNLTPNQFILTERMNIASRLIHSGVEVKRVASEVGFYDDAHFCREFKKFFGVTPSHYRNNISC